MTSSSSSSSSHAVELFVYDLRYCSFLWLLLFLSFLFPSHPFFRVVVEFLHVLSVCTDATFRFFFFFCFACSGGLASTLSKQLVLQRLLDKEIDGVWHTSIHVHGKEYWFGHGMQVGIPKQTQFGTPKEIIRMGETQVDEALFKTFLDEVHSRFNVGTYSLLEHNCNNFSDECCEFLVGKKIPEHILRLPNEILETPFGQSIKPFLKVMESTMRNTRGTTVFAEDSDAISEGRSEVLGSSSLPPRQQQQRPSMQVAQDLAPLLAMGLQAFVAQDQPAQNRSSSRQP